MFRCFNVSMFQCFDVSMFQCFNVSMFQCFNVSLIWMLYAVVEHQAGEVKRLQSELENARSYGELADIDVRASVRKELMEENVSRLNALVETERVRNLSVAVEEASRNYELRWSEPNDSCKEFWWLGASVRKELMEEDVSRPNALVETKRVRNLSVEEASQNSELGWSEPNDDNNAEFNPGESTDDGRSNESEDDRDSFFSYHGKVIYFYLFRSFHLVI